MTDLSSEEGIRIEEVSRACKTHFSTVFRWIVKGVPDRDGNRVRLEAVRVGGKWLTSHAALRRFIEATTPRFEDANSVPRSASARQRASERAAAALAAQGI